MKVSQEEVREEEQCAASFPQYSGRASQAPYPVFSRAASCKKGNGGTQGAVVSEGVAEDWTTVTC